MRYLLIALLLTITTASAQNVNDKPAPDSKPQTPGTAAPAPTATAPNAPGAAQNAGAIDQKFIDAAIKAAGSKEAAARIEITRGWKQLKQGDVEVAIQNFTHAYMLDPKNVEVYWGLGNAMTQQGKFSAASTYYERAIKLDPQNPKLMADIGLSQTYSAFKSTPDPEMQAKLAKDAMQWFDNAEKIDANRPVIYAHRAIALYMLGNYDDAWKNVDKAEALERTSVDPRFIADLTAKQARPDAKKPVAAADTPVKAEAVATPPAVQQLNGQMTAKPADAKAPAPQAQPTQPPLPTTKLSPAVRDASGAKLPTQPAAQQPQAVTAVKHDANAPQAPKQTSAAASPAVKSEAAQQGTQDIKPQAKPEEAKREAPPAPQATPQQASDDGAPEKAAPASPDKTVELVQEKELPQIGPDKRKCLDLQSNEEIIRCVYPPK